MLILHTTIAIVGIVALILRAKVHPVIAAVLHLAIGSVSVAAIAAAGIIGPSSARSTSPPLRSDWR
ncbi:MAG: hypothetical protein L0G94_09825 [Brachybacterium sp.]|uniref:hypothetical protein n=1 Tax=Brachybacterium sp. TaxID=1891286 RepID=UPI0026498C25|nr:hypothetical protein [Brachybacterium sp.]MDN5686952.1 hypothetical protein [Brachybacterium sp.]